MRGNRNIVLYKRRYVGNGAERSSTDRATAVRLPEPRSTPHSAPTNVNCGLVSRLHGMSSISDTGVDPLLRTLGVDTVVVVGISVNIGVTNVTMDLVNLVGTT